MQIGGAVGLRYLEKDKIDHEKALHALAIIHPGAEDRTLDHILGLDPGQWTGATFVGCQHHAQAFMEAIKGSGIEAEMHKEPWPREQVEFFIAAAAEREPELEIHARLD